MVQETEARTGYASDLTDEQWAVIEPLLPPEKEGGRYFFERNDGLQNQDVVYVTENLDAEPRVLLDPNQFSDDATVALGSWSVSPDGRWVAYSTSDGGPTGRPGTSAMSIPVTTSAIRSDGASLRGPRGPRIARGFYTADTRPGKMVGATGQRPSPSTFTGAVRHRKTMCTCIRFPVKQKRTPTEL